MSRKGLEGPENCLQSVMFHRQLLLTHAPRTRPGVGREPAARYSFCDDCGVVDSPEALTVIEYGESDADVVLCERCRETYAPCHSCGLWFLTNRLREGARTPAVGGRRAEAISTDTVAPIEGEHAADGCGLA